MVWLLNYLSTGIPPRAPPAPTSASAATEEEIRLLVAESAERGILDSDERNMVNRVLRLGDRMVDSAMTPRMKIAWLDVAASREDNLEVLRETQFSRYPVYRRDESEVVGTVEVKSLIGSLERGQVDLFARVARPLFVPATARALDLLEAFRDADTQLALAVDEYGDIEGLVTLNDLLTAVVGATAPTADDAGQAGPIVRRDDGSWLVDGSPAGRRPARTAPARSPAQRGRTRFPHRGRHAHHAVRPYPGRRANPSPGKATASRWSTWTVPASTRCW